MYSDFCMCDHMFWIPRGHVSNSDTGEQDSYDTLRISIGGSTD